MIKSGVTSALIKLLEPIQADFQSSSEWQEIEKKAYPQAPETKKKEKKVKDKGSRHPGGSKEVEAQADGHIEGERTDEVNLASGAEAAMEHLDMKTSEA